MMDGRIEMATKIASSHTEMLQLYVDEFFEETSADSATASDIAAWAIKTGRWEAPHDVLMRQAREEFSRAMREEYIHWQ